MQFYKDLKLSQKFAVLGFVLAILLLAAFGCTNWWIGQLGDSFRSYADKDQVIAFNASDMYAQGLQTEQATRNLLKN